MNDLVPSDSGNPFGDEQAKAVQELAKLGGISVEALKPVVGWLGKVVGTVPEDVIAILFGAPLRYLRIKQLVWYQERVEEIHHRRGTKATEALSPALALPLLEAAENETQELLRELWARLIATATDPAKAQSVQRRFVDTLKRFEPLDALLLQHVMQHSHRIGPQLMSGNTIDIHGLASNLKVQSAEVEVAVENLIELRCLQRPDTASAIISSYGRLLILAVQE